MPQTCAAFGCSNRRNDTSKCRGITFHKFPKDPVRRKDWTIAMRRKDFQPNNTTVLCSSHFTTDDFDRTGQTIRLKDCVSPSVFTSTPEHLKKVPHKARLTRTSMKAAEERVVSVVVPGVTRTTPSTAVKSIPDHHYALDQIQVKSKVIKAQKRIDELEKQLRNAKDRERRLKLTVKSLISNQTE
ncbi:THAP domain-containing protein 2 [Gadus morhua]|uniref:THAP domain-containing protein 2-like n=1 Tax=Gadus morhua TaxID=8049 RepID=A0A8C5A0N5_GADMO|nr:THAP domain-containing protein 2-like [Gadus morhua]XP_056443423.1 THAP domain-containing protein 2-like [Gadus chalcogrammus]